MNNQKKLTEKHFLDLSGDKISPMEISATLIIVANRYQPKRGEDIYFHHTRAIKPLLTNDGGIIKIFFCSTADNCDVSIVSAKSIRITTLTRGIKFCTYIKNEAAKIMPQIECSIIINPAT